MHLGILTELPKLQNETIRIRGYQLHDMQPMYECISSSIAEMKDFLPWVHEDYTEQEAGGWVYYSSNNWRTGMQYDFVIEDIETGQFLGGVGILGVNHLQKVAKLGYWIRTDATGKGVATQASQLALQFARDYLGLKQIIVECDIRNKGSIRVAERLGARRLRKEQYEDERGHKGKRYIYLLELDGAEGRT